MKTRSALVLAVAATLVACGRESEKLTGPEPVVAYSAGVSHNAAGFAVYPFRIRPDEGSGSAAWGGMAVHVGTRHPPSPCSSDAVPTNGQTALSFCGVLFNPDGETLEDITFLLTSTGPDGGVFPVRAQFRHPPSPCTTAILRGSLDLVDYPSPGPPTIELTLSTDAGLLIGYPNPGPPGIRYPNPGPPDIRYPNPGPPNIRYPNPGPPTTCEIGVVDVTRG